MDGPVTANRMVLGVHTAWGRTLKDVFQRYKALRGFHQRYQNGFDCQGLWIEVGVERELGLNSKREIEEYGLAEFARRCREVVVRSSRALTEGSIRLGQWMDWGTTTSRSATRTSSTSGGSCGGCTSRVTSTRATARPSGARAAGRRSRPTSSSAATRTAPTRRSSSAFPCSTGPESRSRSGRRRPGRCPRTWPPPSTPRPSTARRADGEWWAVARDPDAEFVERATGRRARRPALRRPLRPSAGRRGGRAPSHPLGRGLPGGGHRNRPHRPGLRRRGLRALARPRPGSC